MIYVTHDQTEALTFADTVVVMHDGRVVQSGTPDELFERPAHTFVGYFIGSPGMNIAACARSAAAKRLIDGHAIALARGYDSLPAGAKIEIGVRPEFVHLTAKAPGLLSGRDRAHRRSRPRSASPGCGSAASASRRACRTVSPPTATRPV